MNFAAHATHHFHLSPAADGGNGVHCPAPARIKETIMTRRLSQLAGPLFLALAGCHVAPTPTAIVVPKIQAISDVQTTWLESATISYIQVPSCAKPSPSAGVTAASYTSDSAAATPAQSRAVRVLAVRYPHPDGRRDVGRAELLTADPSAESRSSTSWRSRLDRVLSGRLPGVEWGPGIQQAKGLDLPVSELQKILIAAGAHNSAAIATSPAEGSVQGRLEINGQATAVAMTTATTLNELADRVNCEGRLISYPGSATELLAAMPK
jgi:hypothetical protein